ncbi:MAG: hypothetical protein AB2810_07155 [Candidatus Thiodiazotropha endolucinida]
MSLFALSLLFLSTNVNAGDVTLNVVGPDGAAVPGFRYIFQEDTTYAVDPNNPATTADGLLSLGFHASNHPPATRDVAGQAENLSGNEDTNSATITGLPDTRYYVSVLPYSGHSISGAPIEVVPGSNELTVTVQPHPIPTAQISIYLFEDNHPINGVPDLPQEANNGSVDWTQFSLFLEEPGGRYGIAGGQVIQDAFGNPLGTVYDQHCLADGSPAYLRDGAGDIVIINGEPALLIDHFCFDAEGNPVVLEMGDGTMHPNPDGTLTVKNIAPGKYGVVIIPPTNPDDSIGWQQTSTIEGSKVIDAWVKANEPPVFVEFGLPGPHVFVGFVKATADGGMPGAPGPQPGEQVATVSGTVTDMHMSRVTRQPTFEFFSGRPFPGCWVGINQVDAAGALGQGIEAAPCDGDSGFSFDLPPGSYQLAIWDANLDVVFAANPFSVDSTGGTCNGGNSCAFGEVAVFNWFTRLNTGVFLDEDLDGFWDQGEPGLGNGERGIGPESQDVTLRWRDGSVYQNFPTDHEGLAPFDEIFPFFHWLVAEVSFANKKATGATFVVDAGGPVDTANGDFPGFGELNPQPQLCTPAIAANAEDPNFGCTPGDALINPNTTDNLSRTETGAVLTQGFQGFLGQTSVMQFGKVDYIGITPPYNDGTFHPPEFVGENGGISGMVFYATTRAENEPQFAAAEEWEPGVPRVQLALYADGDIDCPALAGQVNCDIDWNNDGTLDPDDGVVENINGIPGIQYADVDNYPLGWSTCDPSLPICVPGPEDVDRNGNGDFDLGDALQVTWTDSWDDSLPEGCQGLNNIPGIPVEPSIDDERCFDGLRNFNQVRPGVFDGGFAFEEYDMDYLASLGNQSGNVTILNNFFADRNAAVSTVAAATGKMLELPEQWILPGDYIVEMATPPGYESLKEEHKNVDFGDEYTPSLQALPVACVGDPRTVPQYLTMVTRDGSGTDPGDGSNLVDAALLGDEGVFAPFANETRPSCDRKLVPLSSGQNAAAEFFLMTDVPLAGNVSGVILNDLANEFNPNSPAFGEKFAPRNVPVSFYDWNGNEVNRVYADQYGRYNLMVPSTSTANLGIPSGMSPNMLVSCMNDAGPIDNPAYLVDADNDGLDDNTGAPAKIIDPNFKTQYSQFCYTFQYMPGVITYLDTPVVPVAAHADRETFPLDCEQTDNTPMISSVTRTGGLPGPFGLAGDTIRINSMGMVDVPNPYWDGVIPAEKLITRDYSFNPGVPGMESRAFLIDLDDPTVPIELSSYSARNEDFIEGTIPAVGPGEYQVMVSNGDVSSPVGVTLTVGVDVTGLGERAPRANYSAANQEATTSAVWRVPGDFATIQEAIGDPVNNPAGPSAAAGDLILVAPGDYDEMVIMWKPVKLQGWGAGAVTLNARQVPTEKVANWRNLATTLESNGSISLLPGQALAPFGFPGLGAQLFPTEEGAGIFVAGTNSGGNRFGHPRNRGARIDGFTIIGASTGGGIVANGYNQWLNISNNKITANSGFYGGGIRVGHPQLTHEIETEDDPDFIEENDNYAVGTLVYTDSRNDRVNIHHNLVQKNGVLSGAGAGISLNTGADAYRVRNNWVCGNFAQGSGAGIAHLGLNRGGIIEDNMVIFNESFQQTPGTSPDGGGIYIAGQPALVPEAETNLMLSPGTGNVTVDANIIRGNLAGAGDGGGISITSVNGQDIPQSRFAADGEESDEWIRGRWYGVNLFNNMVNNNVAGVAGGGVSILDSPKVVIRNNTVARNDSTSTGSQAFADPANPNESQPLPAGIVSRTHSNDMAQAMALAIDSYDEDDNPAPGAMTQNATYSNPTLRDTIVYHNRSFYWSNNGDPTQLNGGLLPDCTGCALTDYEAYTNDMGVVTGVTESLTDLLNPRYCLLQDGTEYDTVSGTNELITGDVGFVNPVYNEATDSLLFPEFKVIQAAGAFDEGGNFLQVSFGPVTLVDSLGALYDYHLAAGNQADNEGGPTGGSRTQIDFDNDPRPATGSDIGADELAP